MAACFLVPLFLGQAGVLTDNAILSRLAQPTTVAIQGKPLGGVLADLSRATGVPFHFDMKALQDAGVSLSQPVTVHVENVSRRTVLRIVLRQALLTSRMDKGKLIITTKAALPSEVRDVSIADVLDALDPREFNLVIGRGFGPFGVNSTREEVLAELIKNNVEPESRVHIGGAGTIEFVPARRTFIVRQHAEAHQEVIALLMAIRRFMAPFAQDIVHVGVGLDRNELGLLLRGPATPIFISHTSSGDGRALDKVVKSPIRDTPLLDVARRLNQVFKLPIAIDRRALKQAGLSLASPLSADAADISVEELLDRLLTPVGLVHRVEAQLVMITTK